MFEDLRSKLAAALAPPAKSGPVAPVPPTGKGVSGGKGTVGPGGQLPPVDPPKVKPKQQSFPGYVISTTPTTAVLQQKDLQLANTDIVSTFRNATNTYEVLRNLVRANPDLSAAVSAYLRVGIPEKYWAIARGPDGTVNDQATALAMEILSRFDKLPGYDSGFSQVDSIRSNSEALAKEGIVFGGMAMELVLDGNRLPYKFQPIPITQIKYYEDWSGGLKGLRPTQLVAGNYIDLDFPTVFIVYLDPSLVDPYPHSPMEAAIQPVLGSSTFLSDLRRVLYRHVYPRYDVSIDEEKLRANIPAEILQDPDRLPAFLNNIVAEVGTVVNGMGPEEALIHFDFISVGYIQNDDGVGTAEKFQVVKDIIDADLAKGAKTLPAILGNGAGSQNIASTETLLFMMGANSMVRLKLQEMYSKALTLAVRLFGQDVTVEFEFDTIDMRPVGEMEAFKSMYHSRIKDQWSLGLIGDTEACLRLTGKMPPAGFKTLTGSYFMTGGDPNGITAAPGADTKNPYSGAPQGGGQSGGGATQQAQKSTAPKQAKTSK